MTRRLLPPGWRTTQNNVKQRQQFLAEFAQCREQSEKQNSSLAEAVLLSGPREGRGSEVLGALEPHGEEHRSPGQQGEEQEPRLGCQGSSSTQSQIVLHFISSKEALLEGSIVFKGILPLSSRLAVKKSWGRLALAGAMPQGEDWLDLSAVPGSDPTRDGRRGRPLSGAPRVCLASPGSAWDGCLSQESWWWDCLGRSHSGDSSSPRGHTHPAPWSH